VKLFIDTWGWVELRDSRGARHHQAKQFYLDFRQRRGVTYTTDYILDETVTHLFRRLPFAKADESLTVIQQTMAAGFLRLERITEARFEKAIALRRKHSDKPRISFTDFTSMVVMSELGITDVMTEDDHFLHVGMGFKKVP
jgi:predicted nucleic acid-binding protein